MKHLSEHSHKGKGVGGPYLYYVVIMDWNPLQTRTLQ